MANFMPAVRYGWCCRGAIYLSHEPFLFIATPFQACYVITCYRYGGMVPCLSNTYCRLSPIHLLLALYNKRSPIYGGPGSLYYENFSLCSWYLLYNEGNISLYLVITDVME